VARYREFVRAIAETRKVIIGIDELDKMQPAEARQLLNDVKVLFGERNCFYLVSMSEDAMSSFERRGMPIRDVFDSSFDTVLHVDPLTADEARALLEKRVVGMGVAGHMLCHALAGGLPRELIRVARDVREAARYQPIVHLNTVTKALVKGRMAVIEHATAQVAQKAVAADGSQPVVGWLRSLRPVHRRVQLRARWEISEVLGSLANSILPAERIEEQRLLVVELAVAAYHADAVWAFFVGLKRSDLDEAMSEADSHPAAIELIARARADMTVSPRIAWDTINQFRHRVGLTRVDYPVAFAQP
jgi:hypothetical protein